MSNIHDGTKLCGGRPAFGRPKVGRPDAHAATACLEADFSNSET